MELEGRRCRQVPWDLCGQVRRQLQPPQWQQAGIDGGGLRSPRRFGLCCVDRLFWSAANALERAHSCRQKPNCRP